MTSRKVVEDAAGLIFTGCNATNAAPAQGGAEPGGRRRQVLVNGRRVKSIDVHCHCVIPEVEAIVKGTPFESSARGRGGNVLGPERLAIMDRQGVDIQALSINGYWWYGADRDLARRIVQLHEGDLEFSSQPGRTVFRVRLPASGAASGRTGEAGVKVS